MKNAEKLRDLSTVFSGLIVLGSIVWSICLWANSSIVEPHYNDVLEEIETSSHVSGAMVTYGFVVLIFGITIALIVNYFLKAFADLVENSFSKETQNQYHDNQKPWANKTTSTVNNSTTVVSENQNTQ